MRRGTERPVSSIHSVEELLKVVALVCAAAAAAILLWYLVRRPPLGRVTKVLLLLGLGLLPVIVALTGNIAGYEFTLSRQFCGSCHVMGPYIRDAADPKSQSLAAIHSRNRKFGDQSCYTCHADYDMFGAITTKMTGLKHLYYYVTEYAGTGPDGEGGPPIKLYKRQDLEKGKLTQEAFNQRMNGVCGHLRGDLGREARRVRRRRPLQRPDLHRLPLRDPPHRVVAAAGSEDGGGEEVRHEQVRKLVFISAIATLLALALMAASIIVPTPLLLVLAMSVGQGLGTLSLALYLLAIVLDLQGAGAGDEALEAAGEARGEGSEPPART